MSSLFDELAAHSRLTFEQGRMLPLEAYRSEELLTREVGQLFCSDWLCVGRTKDIPNPGDFFIAEIPYSTGQDRSIILLRSDGAQQESEQDGAVRAFDVKAFDNVCIHRGGRLLEGSGTANRIVCPYHAWTYRLDGTLVGGPFMQESVEQDGTPYDPSRYRLPELQVEVWEGFIFVSQDPEATPLAPNLSGLTHVVGRYQMADYVPVHQRVDIWATNWKLLVENFMDTYHVFKVHKNSFGADGDSTLDTTMYPGTDHWTHHRVVPATGPDLAHVSNTSLEGDWRKTTVLAALFPGFVIQLQPDWLWYLRITPLGTDQVRIAWQVAVAPEMLAGQADPDGYIKEVLDLVHQVNGEDKPVIEGVRRGLHRPQFDRAPLSYLERNVFDFDRYVSRRLTGSHP